MSGLLLLCMWLGQTEYAHIQALYWRPRVCAMAKQFKQLLTLDQRDIVMKTWRDSCVLRKDSESRWSSHPIRAVKPTAMPQCFYAGRCVCVEPDLRAFVSFAQQCWRRMFRIGTTPHQAVETGLVVLRFHSAGNESRWFQMSHADRNTWRCAFWLLLEDTDEVRVARATACGEIALLVAAVAVMRLWDAFKDLHFSDAWNCSAYSLVAHGEQGPTFNEFTLEH